MARISLVGINCRWIAAVAGAMAFVGGIGGPNLGAGEIVLAEGGRARATIVVADKPDLTPAVRSTADARVELTVRDWAQFLAEKLRAATGATFPIVTASAVQESGAAANGALILVGTSALSRQLGFDGAAGMNPEEARVAAFDRGVAIYGDRLDANAPGAMARLNHDLFALRPPYPAGTMCDRGSGHAVVWFLERFVGYRFYYRLADDLGTVTPSLSRLAVASDADFRTAPAFLFRSGMGRPQSAEGEIIPLEYAALRLGASVDLAVNHVLNVTPKTHPKRDDMFAKNEDGSPMYDRAAGIPPVYAAPDLVDIYIEQVRRLDRTGEKPYDSGGKGARILADPHRVIVGPPDARWVDYDPRSRAWYRPEAEPVGSQSDLLGQFVARLAQAVQREWPGRRVTWMSQNNYAAAPSDRVALPDNVDVLACVSVRPTPMNTQPVYAAFCDQFIEEWHRKLGGQRMRLALWDYPDRPQASTKIPCYFPHTIQQFYQRHRDKFIGGNHSGGNAVEIAFPMRALWMELMWDPDLNVEEWYRDFCRQMFGPAAEPMCELILFCAERYEKTVWTEQLSAFVLPDSAAYEKIFPPDAVARVQALYERAAALVSGDPKGLYARRLALMYNENGEFGLHAFLSASRAYHSPQRSQTLVGAPGREGDREGGVVVDGRLSDRIWRQARRYQLWEGGDPSNPRPATQGWETRVQFVHTADALYVALRWSAGGKPPDARAAATANVKDDDHVAIVFQGKGGRGGEEAFLDAIDLKPEEAEAALAKRRGDVTVRLNAAGLCNLPGATAKATREGDAAVAELRLPWTALAPTLKLPEGSAPPKRLRVDVRRFAPAAPGGGARRFAYAANAERAELLFLAAERGEPRGTGHSNETD